MNCNGSEALLLNCVHTTVLVTSSSYWTSTVASVICQGNTTAQTECTSGESRLVGGEKESEGRVEICMEGFWSAICDEQWGQQEALVTCKQAGLPSSGKSHAMITVRLRQR